MQWCGKPRYPSLKSTWSKVHPKILQSRQLRALELLHQTAGWVQKSLSNWVGLISLDLKWELTLSKRHLYHRPCRRESHCSIHPRRGRPEWQPWMTSKWIWLKRLKSAKHPSCPKDALHPTTQAVELVASLADQDQSMLYQTFSSNQLASKYMGLWITRWLRACQASLLCRNGARLPVNSSHSKEFRLGWRLTSSSHSTAICLSFLTKPQ